MPHTTERFSVLHKRSDLADVLVCMYVCVVVWWRLLIEALAFAHRGTGVARKT